MNYVSIMLSMLAMSRCKVGCNATDKRVNRDHQIFYGTKLGIIYG